ncbi:MAG: MFS transporter [Acidobacteria bacterium]|nr:MFS transporter [Acidobacteriota bacterium]MBS1864670.1 MFS transporter [Acidobacteriota bacterium]
MTAGKTSHIRWALIFWLFVLSAVAYLDRVNIAIAGPLLQSEFRLSNIQLGWIFSAFLAGYALFQTPGGRLADKLGARRVLALAVVWWGIFSALTAIVPHGFHAALLVLIPLRFALGAGEAVMYPASNQFVARWIPSSERGLANGFIFSGVGVGAGFTPPLITYIMLRHGWRSSFLVCAALGLIVGFVWYLIARNTPEEHPEVSASELAKIKAGLPTPSFQQKPKLISWARMLQSKEVLAVTLSYFTYGYVAWIFFNWFFIYLAKVRGLNLKASALYSMLPFIAMAICSPLGGFVSDAIAKSKGSRAGRGGVAVFAMVLAAIFLVIGSRAQNTQVAIFVLAGGAGALYLSQSSFWSVTADIGGASSGSVSGFMNMGNQIGGVITASLTPLIASWFGWTSAFLVAAVLCLCGALCWLFVDPQKRLDSEEN